ncbi:replicative DNA helicase [Acidithiobacillus ferriphilus]|uniref:replicative DNA helicase n=1 Tax=Acidithiobacillus ferriphilus TaxID=1689834 RepID=UPI002DBA5755|nr:replicative DNA helicase [Acidithiobacillus ferriphilus]MEB8475627.1 replicative DNA helicase [Acidithiobacillus ferriphilus]
MSESEESQKENNVVSIAQNAHKSGGFGDQAAGLVQIKDLLPWVIDRVETSAREKKKLAGLPTGFADLDDITTGLYPGQLIVLAGRPSMGKTSFAMNIAEHVACVKSDPVAVFNLEMSTEDVVLRTISSRGRVDQHRLRKGNMLGDDWQRIAYAIGELEGSPLFVHASPIISVEEIYDQVKQLKQEQNVRLIVVDCLQRLLHSNETEEISEIVRALKTMAMELQLPVILTSHLNREIESRMDKRPQITDLRHFGILEDEADLILFLYRDEVYYRDREDLLGWAEVIIGKHRNGPLGTVRLCFFGEYGRFENAALPDPQHRDPVM